jgi:hypothetical protein
MEFDKVDICCNFSEWNSLQDWTKHYHGTEHLLEAMGIDEDIAMGDNEEAIDESIREYIQDNGILIEFDGGIIVSSF